MRKIINAEGQEFVPVSTDDLVLDAVPTVNSFNSVTSDAVARAVAGASGEVPQVLEGDDGKVLTAVYDAGGPAVEWAAAPSGLPDTTGASQGDVLSIGSTGPEWAAPSSTVATSGVISGDGSVADPVVLTTDSTLTSVTVEPWGTPTTCTKNSSDFYGFIVPSATVLDILSNGKVAKFTMTGGTGIGDNTPGWTYNWVAPALAIYDGEYGRTDIVAFNPVENGASGITGNQTFVIDPSDIEQSTSANVSALVSAAGLGRTVKFCIAVSAYNSTYGSSIFPGQPDWNDPSTTEYTTTVAIQEGSASGPYLAVTNPVPAYAAGDAGKVLKVNAGATGVEWGTAGGSGGSSNVEIITLSSSAAAAIDTFAAAVHTAYAAGKVVVAKLVNADSVYTMYLPMTKAYEGETIQYFFGGQAMYWNEGAFDFQPEEYFMKVAKYDGINWETVFKKARPTGLSWTPFSA